MSQPLELFLPFILSWPGLPGVHERAPDWLISKTPKSTNQTVHYGRHAGITVYCMLSTEGSMLGCMLWLLVLDFLERLEPLSSVC